MADRLVVNQDQQTGVTIFAWTANVIFLFESVRNRKCTGEDCSKIMQGPYQLCSNFLEGPFLVFGV